MIQTVTGNIDKQNLGKILSHEHLKIDLSAFVGAHRKNPQHDRTLALDTLYLVKRDPYVLADNTVIEADEDVLRNELALFRAAGGGTIVDLTLPEIGRDPAYLKELSEKSGVHIVMGCGFYLDSVIPAAVRKMNERERAAVMIREIEDGDECTGVRAGVIGEIGTSGIVTEDEWKNVRAAGIASLETGKSIHLHTSLYEENGLALGDELIKMGVAPRNICIDHVDVVLRGAYCRRLLDKGVFIEFDNFGKEFYAPRGANVPLTGRFAYDLERCEMLASLIQSGYIDQLLVSNDICIKSMLTAYGGAGYGHIYDTVYDMCLDCGISEEDFKKLTEDNPASFLQGGDGD
ncbi:MAG: hypothetical protein LBH18_02300 [Spirochaetaceae bacterium]|jgi:phosphotriesterase-related protein|nr:hypothetical protein [Spirochaetaceae bacterium]